VWSLEKFNYKYTVHNKLTVSLFILHISHSHVSAMAKNAGMHWMIKEI